MAGNPDRSDPVWLMMLLCPFAIRVKVSEGATASIDISPIALPRLNLSRRLAHTAAPDVPSQVVRPSGMNRIGPYL
jgi:hypothetical protein